MLSTAVGALTRGEPVIVYDFDDREAEADLVFLAKYATPAAIADLRLNAGAPLSVYISWNVGQKIGLETYTDFVKATTEPDSVYRELVNSTADFDPRFSITFDFRGNKTGCSHFETSRCIREFANLVEAKSFGSFSRKFRSPGHVPLIIASPRLLEDRVGHTELIMTVLRQEKMSEIAVASEIINPATGKSGDLEFARQFAHSRKLQIVLGEDIIRAYGPPSRLVLE